MGEVYNLFVDQRYCRVYLFEILNGEGKYVLVEVLSVLFFGEDCILSGLFFIVKDQMECLVLENRIGDIVEIFEDVLDVIFEGFVLYDVDDWLVINNDNYCEIYVFLVLVMFFGNRFEDILCYGLNCKQYDMGNLIDDEWFEYCFEWYCCVDGSVLEQLLGDGCWFRVLE